MSFQMISGGVTAAKGFTAAGVHCGIRKNKSKRDLALIYSGKPCAAAAVYTKNLVKGAPLAVTKKHLANGTAQAVICNSGNANTCNADGEQKAERMCELAAAALGIDPGEVIVASTGVIGQVLPIEPIEAAVPSLAAALSRDGATDAAEAIMTTDTYKKEFALEIPMGGVTVTLGGMAKGSGMIHPNMATMLGFLTTDAAVSAELLHEALLEAVEQSFNMVSVDGDTSTNDMVCILASGEAKNPVINEKNEDYAAFCRALTALCKAISRELARDGEGATKLLVCRVSGAKTLEDARGVAKSVICSSLFKAAMFGADANWGRVLCAIGYSGCDVDVSKVSVAFSSEKGSIPVCENGAGIDFDEDAAKEILLCGEILIDVGLHDGAYAAEAYGCDLTYDYVKINGDYRT